MASEWKTHRVGDIAAAMGDAPFGSLIKNHDYTDSGALVVQGKNIQGRTCDWSDRRYVSHEKYQSLRRSHCMAGDLLFPKVGTIGKVGILTACPGVDEYVLSTNTMRFRADPQVATTDYVYYFFTWSETVSLIHALNSNSVQPVFNFTSLKNFQIPLPPLAEQKAIASVLGALDDKIEVNRRMNATLEAMARALFQSWFVDFDPVRAKSEGRQPEGMDADTAALFPAEFEDSELGMIPKGWTIQPVGEIVECVGGGTPSTAEPQYWEGGTHHWTTPKDFSSLQAPILLNTERRLTPAGISKISSGLLPIGTLLLSSRAPVGYLAISAIAVAINQGFIAMKCNKRASNYFMLNWCQQNMAEIEGRATGTTFAEISKQNFRPIKVVLPPTELMATFTTQVAPLYAQITANLRESRTLAALRDTLLPKLLSGEVSVKSLEKE